MYDLCVRCTNCLRIATWCVLKHTAFARGDFFLRFRPSLSCDLRSFEWRVVLSWTSGLCHSCGPWPFEWRDYLEGFWLVETKVRPKDDPSEGCDWSRRKSIWRMIRPKDVIGRDESPSKGWSVRRMWLVDTKIHPKDDPSEGCDWSIWRSHLGDRPKGCSEGFWLAETKQLSVWQCVRLVVLPDGSDWTRREPCLFFLDTTDWTVQCICLDKNASDWPILRSAFSVFFGLLSHAMLDSQTRFTRKQLRKSVFFGRQLRRSDLFLTRKQTKQTSPCFTYSTRGGVYILCTMIVDGAW